MSFLFKHRPQFKKPSASVVCTLIGSGTTISGDIHFEGGLRVEGVIEGTVYGNDNSMLILAKGACIKGQIKVEHAIINAPVEGPLVICKTLELQSEARINGDVSYKDLVIKSGAIINGRMTHLQDVVVTTTLVDELEHCNFR